jgi:DNA-binding transcriptional MerR regulator
MTKEFLSVSEAARAVGVSRQTLLMYEAQGIVSPQRVGVQRAYSREDVRAIIDFRMARAKRRA